MASIRRNRIPDKDWEHHKPVIKKLYLDDKSTLEGEHGLMNVMRGRYNFSPSKAQYETRFKRWGFRKNLRSEDWQSIANALAERERSGQSSAVYLFERLLSEEKVKKELLRYRIKAGVGNSNLPDGITIRDVSHIPESSLSVLQPTHSQGGSPKSTINEPIRMPSIPLPTVDDFLSMESSMVLSRLPTPLFDVNSPFTNNEYSEIRLESTLASMDDGPMNFFDSTVSTSTLALIQGSSFRIAPVFLGLTYQLCIDIGPCIESAMLLLTERTRQELQQQPYDTVLFSMIMYLLMNNFAGDNDMFEKLFRQLRQFSISQMENLLDMVPHPYSVALEQSMLTIAIKVGATTVVQALLNRGLEKNTALCHVDYDVYIPLHLACLYRRVEIVRLLIHLGAEVNIMSSNSTIGYLFDDRRRIKGGAQDVHADRLAILHLLINAGAEFACHELKFSAFWQDEEVVDLFFKYTKLSKAFNLVHWSDQPLTLAISILDRDRGTRAAKLLLGTEFELGQVKIGSDAMNNLQRAGHLTASQGNETLVDFFLKAGVRPTTAWLVEAVRSNSIAIVNRLLQEGVKANSVVKDGDVLTMSYAGTFPEGVDPLLRESAMSRRATTPLAEAIRWRRTELIQIFLDMGVLIGQLGHAQSIVALSAASEIGDLERVRYLITFAEPAGKSHVWSHILDEGLAFGLATLGNHADIVEELLEAGFRPDSMSIISAILVRNMRLLRLFIDLGLSETTGNVRGILYLAIRWGDIEAVKILLEAGVLLHEVGWHIPLLDVNTLSHPKLWTTPLGYALARGDETIVQMLLDSGASIDLERTSINDDKKSPLCIVIESGHENAVQSLLSQGADPCDPSALLAASHQSLKMLQMLLNAFDARYPTRKRSVCLPALRMAIQNRDIAKVRLLANYTNLNDTEKSIGSLAQRTTRWGTYNVRDVSPLGVAIATCNPEIIQIILDAGGDPNTTVTARTWGSGQRWTALLAAVATSHLETVELICSAGARVNYAAHRGTTRTPLQLAVEIGSPKIVEALLRGGAAVNAAPCLWGGGTALQIAAIKGHIGIAELLIRNEADVNAPRGKYEGRTAFEGAAERGRLDMLLFLYNNGVDLISDGGEQVRRAKKLAEYNAQLAAKELVEQLSWSLNAPFMFQ